MLVTEANLYNQKKKWVHFKKKDENWMKNIEKLTFYGQENILKDKA